MRFETKVMAALVAVPVVLSKRPPALSPTILIRGALCIRVNLVTPAIAVSSLLSSVEQP
jgi:hypothetical protein